jgi:predicted flavoprotein YhiN
MTTSSIPIPIPAANRKKRIAGELVWKAMAIVQIEYHNNEKLKIVLRPKRSAIRLKKRVLTKRPAKKTAIKVAMLSNPKTLLLTGLKIPLL